MVQAELSKAPDNAGVRLLSARVAERAGDHDVMIAEINGLVAKSPESAELFMMLGRAYRIAGKNPEAVEAFSKARQLKPGEVATNLNLALAYEAMGDRVKAKPLYEQVLNLSPDNPIALNNLAYTLAETGGDLELALKYAVRARQKYPQDGDIADTLGWIYIRKNLSENAIHIFQDLVRQNPAHVTWRYHLAMALFQKGDKPNARRELEAALKNKPTRDEEGRIRELLAKTGP
ncbi:MAG: tetratricopeptide repeat protein [Bryobacteraceae bacterium]